MTITVHDWLIPGLTSRLIELHGLTGSHAMTMGQIAQRLNAEFHTEITRNAVIGRCRRLGVPSRPQPIPNPASLRFAGRSRADAPIAPVEATSPRNGESLTILQLREGDCHFPLGRIEDYPPFQYCGKPAVFGRAYCPGHCKIAYNSVTARWA